MRARPRPWQTAAVNPLMVAPARRAEAPTYVAYQAGVQKNADLWLAVYRTASIPAEAVEHLRRMAGRWRLLVLSEDWCSDAVSTVPVIACWAERAGVDLRILGRDANPDLMDAHLTSGTRSIPVVMVLDDEGREWAWWGPRPAAVQRWMRSEGILLSKEERNRRKRSWYARDRGRTTIRELLETVDRAGRRRDAADGGR